MKMVHSTSEALQELRANGACKFHAGYITPTEWKTLYLPALRAEFPDLWYTVNTVNHICVRAK